MPFAVLGQLSFYERAVLQAARFLFFDRHPDRRRVGLDLKLSLASVGTGSSLLQIHRELRDFSNRDQDLFGHKEGDVDDFVLEGREMVVDLIRQEGKSAALRDSLGGPHSPTTSSAFNLLTSLIGLSEALHEEDGLGLRGPVGANDEATMMPGFGENLRAEYGLASAQPEALSLIGTIRMANRDQNRYLLLLDDGRRIQLEAPAALFPDLGRNLTSDKPHLLEVRGVAHYQKNRIARFVVDSFLPFTRRITLKEAPRSSLAEQLYSLQSIQDGWGEYGDEPAPTYTTIRSTRAIIRALDQRFGVPTPFLYPTPTGAVRAEWPGFAWNAALEIAEHGLKLITVRTHGAGQSLVQNFDPAGLDQVGEELAAKLAEGLKGL